ncbi:unnamed protein product [Pleuronectes platessa]|uniref:Uncharacterized protein n=1 Tax=Pleuronectes platessa TaxID=8262 RepID=A0A9N7YJL2_PLEPL|nr:unnamed protein product [Pleuronectes platessa]
MGYLQAAGWGLRGHKETKGDLSDETKQRLAGYRQAKRGEDPRHVFCFCIVPINPGPGLWPLALRALEKKRPRPERAEGNMG